LERIGKKPADLVLAVRERLPPGETLYHQDLAGYVSGRMMYPKRDRVLPIVYEVLENWEKEAGV